jgi:hypothetical protein
LIRVQTRRVRNASVHPWATNFADLDAKQRIVHPPLGFVDVELGRRHVIVAAEFLATGAPLVRSPAAWAISRSNHPHIGS